MNDRELLRHEASLSLEFKRRGRIVDHVVQLLLKTSALPSSLPGNHQVHCERLTAVMHGGRGGGVWRRAVWRGACGREEYQSELDG